MRSPVPRAVRSRLHPLSGILLVTPVDRPSGARGDPDSVHEKDISVASALSGNPFASLRVSVPGRVEPVVSVYVNPTGGDRRSAGPSSALTPVGAVQMQASACSVASRSETVPVCVNVTSSNKRDAESSSALTPVGAARMLSPACPAVRVSEVRDHESGRLVSPTGEVFPETGFVVSQTGARIGDPENAVGVCQEDTHTLPCSHVIFRTRFDEMLASGYYACPLCGVSMIPMAET